MNHNFFIVFIFGICLISCSDKKVSTKASPTTSIDTDLKIPDTRVNKSELSYEAKKSIWTLNGQVYSGYAVSCYSDSMLKEKFGVLEGRKQGEEIHWYADGHYQRVANYHKGKLHGEKKSWSPDSPHILLAHLHYRSGKPHGEQTKWYPTGELFKKLNLAMGKEEGLQRAYRKNGALFANYEAREGRIFGLKKAALCFSLEDEQIQWQGE